MEELEILEQPTKHFTREIISQFFEKEKVLRTLSGEEEDKYRKEYEKEIIRLGKLLEEINQEMEELQKKKRDKTYE